MTDDRASEGLEHLQRAAIEMIAAARAFLDVAEDLVNDPSAASAVVQTAAAMGRMVLHGTAPTAEPQVTPDEPKVRHIHVG
jgi:D-arabinose 1-dehydrogenase-like Zn-dependent alcohol dehydrogenase